jgi:uncharacterized membrane protein YebE (DUF533 family)
MQLSGQKSGEFYCPDCRSTRKYRTIRRLGIKKILGVIPIPCYYREPGIICVKCGGVFDDIMTHSSPAKTREAFQPLIKRVMILMMLADGHIGDEEAECVANVFSRVAKTDLSREEIDSEVELIKKEGENLHEYLRKIVPYLSPRRKKEIVESACYIAASDGHLQDEEKQLMEEIVASLNLSSGYYESILEKIKAEANIESVIHP